MTFGEKLRQLRVRSGLTQEQLAQKIYVTRTAISKWETDRGYPGIDSLKQLSEIFGVSIDYLMCPNGDESADGASNADGATNENSKNSATNKNSENGEYSAHSRRMSASGKTRLFYVICGVFLAAAFLFALPARLFQMPYLFVASVAATVLFAVFAMLATPPSARVKDRQTLTSYALSRMAIVAVISLAVITTLTKLFA